MTFAELIGERWSCREYEPEPLGEETLRELFATAQKTASWCNTQPWQVHLLTGETTEWFGRELRAHVESGAPMVSDIPLPEDYVGVYADRRREAGYALYEALEIERSDRAARTEQMLKNFTFFGAPHAAIITSDKIQGPYAVHDCGGYVANLMNAALDMGIGSIAQGAIGMHADKVRELLDLPDDRLVICAVAFGRPKATHPVNRFRTSRAELDSLVHQVQRP